jgi:hypothetical protein
LRVVRLAGDGDRRCERRRASSGRSRSASLARARCPRDQWRLGFGRVDRKRRTAAGRNCLGFDRRGRRGISRRADREDFGLSHGRRRRDLFGYDAAIDYKAAGIDEALAAACPDGVHVYFDNTSGAISDAVYPRLAVGARVVVCGTASISSWDPWPMGPRIERHLLVKRARAQGFVIFDHMDRYEASVARLADWVRSGQLRYHEDILEGLESCPDALAGLYRGENKGKRLIRL